MLFVHSIGEKDVGRKVGVLIPSILLERLVAMFGAWFFAKLSGRYGNLKALILSVLVWIIVCIYAFTIKQAAGFIVAAFVIGIVMGGSQSLARSTYSKMLPETTDHTSFFSFYDVTEKLATVAGTFSFGIIEAITGSMRYSVLAITAFFGIGLVFLVMLLVHKGREQNA